MGAKDKREKLDQIKTKKESNHLLHSILDIESEDVASK